MNKLYLFTGLGLLIASLLLMIQWPVFMLLGIEIPYPGKDLTLYLVTTVGALFALWGWLLVLARNSDELAKALAKPTAVCFGLLALARVLAFIEQQQVYQLVGPVTLLEAVLFIWLAVRFYRE